MLKIDTLSKRFGDTIAVHDFTLSIPKGEFLILLGPSGCGKTTVIRLIAGLETPDSGQITMSEEDWTNLPPQKRNVAMVFQQYALYPQRTVRGNIEYPLRLRKMNSAQCRMKVDCISSLLGITSLLDRKPRQLSGGEAQRVALARALVREPTCFLLDEPLSNLDAQLRLKARAEIKRLQRELKVTTLYVTHDQEEAIALADRVAVMNQGQLVQLGTAEELFQRPATTFVAAFLGRPPMNLVKARVTDDEFGSVKISLESSDGGNYSLPVGIRETLARGSKLKVGFRPDHVKLIRESDRDKAQSAWHIPGHVIIVEGLEPEYTVHCDTPIGTIFVRTAYKPAEGPTKLSLPAAMAHYFHAENGKRLE